MIEFIAFVSIIVSMYIVSKMDHQNEESDRHDGVQEDQSEDGPIFRERED